MENYKKIDIEFFISKYGIPKKGNPHELWNKIKENKDLLHWAVSPIKDNSGKKDSVNGLAICDSILIDYNNIDKDIYQKLINLIYSNTNIARIVQDGYSNGGYSYLLMSLWNLELKLTEEQKEFAVNEAMNKIGTTRYKQKSEEYYKKLEEHGINDDITTTINIDGCINPISAKAKNKYMNYLFSSLSNTQAHGTGEFDIRYWILRNPNWSLEEKQKLIMDFWYNDETYEETLEEWEWGIANYYPNSKKTNAQFDIFSMYEYSYNTLLNFYNNKQITDRIWDEIQFCKQMHKLRPKQWELEFEPKKKVFVQTNDKTK